MFALGIVDQRDSGFGKACKIGNLARVVHAQLNHSDLVSTPQAQQRHGYANVVVKVALGRKCIALPPGPQNGRDHLRHRGLAITARHCNQGQIKLRTPARSQLSKSQCGINNFKSWQSSRCQPLMRNRCDGTALSGFS